MKDAEEYLEDIKEKYNIGTAWQVTKPYILETLKQAQTDAWNEALDKAAENAELTIEGSDYHSISYQDLANDDLIIVDLDSILKLKI